MEKIENLDLIFEKEITFDEPIKYQCVEGFVDIFPIKVKDYMDFNLCNRCLLLDQYNDAEGKDDLSIYQMTYLDYLLYRSTKHPEELLNTQVIKLLSLCFNIDFFDANNQLLVFTDEKGHNLLGFNEIKISSKDFDNIRQIICMQNDIDLTLFTLDPRVRYELTKTLALKNSEAEDSSLEDKVVSLSLVTGFDINTIKELSIRKFKKFLERSDLLISYKIATQASMSGFVQVDESNRPPHWLSRIDKDVTKNVTDYDKFANTNGIAKAN